jgi:5-methylphenazine-1-carboxylate 1-monooxygenase
VKVIVAGAGIGGLSAALSLHAAGIEALVIDSAAALRPLGVGINLMPHAIWGFASGRNIGYRWPQYSIHHAARRGRAQLPPVADCYQPLTVTSGGS